MRGYSGWVIAGVVCLILITLAVTGIVSFGNPPQQTTPTSSQALVQMFNYSTRALSTNMHNVPFVA